MTAAMDRDAVAEAVHGALRQSLYYAPNSISTFVLDKAALPDVCDEIAEAILALTDARVGELEGVLADVLGASGTIISGSIGELYTAGFSGGVAHIQRIAAEGLAARTASADQATDDLK